MKLTLITLVLMAVNIAAFAQFGVGTTYTVSDRVEGLSLSFQNDSDRKFGLNLRTSFGFTNLDGFQNRQVMFNNNFMIKRRFLRTDYSNFYVGAGAIIGYQRLNNKNYFDWGFNVPVGIEIFPRPQNRKFSISVETGLYYKTFKQRGMMPSDENRFSGYGSLSLHYYFGRKTKK